MLFKLQNIKIDEKPKLFVDYLYDFEKISPFFKWHPLNDWSVCIEERLANYSLRPEIVEVLYHQNQKWNASDKTLSYVDKLKAPNAVAVVTGQQAGIFGGPLYTIYKILSVIKLVEYLQKKYDKWFFVPIFWMEVGDNDYKEINHFYFFTFNNELERLSLSDLPNDYRSIALRKIPSEITELHKRFSEISLPSEFRDQIVENLKRIYTEGKSFALAFAELLHYLFGNYGLVVMDPTEKRVANLAKPLYYKVLQKSGEINNVFERNNDSLIDKGYHLQIALEPGQSLLFIENEDKARSKIILDGEMCIIQNPQKKSQISENSLFDLISQSPDKFTPNVVLRPVLQDFLLPTVAYIGGPAEISYAAQLKQIYQLLEVVEPIFYPRTRITVVENKIQKIINKYELDIRKILILREMLVDEFISSHTDQEVHSAFKMAEQHIKKAMDELKSVLHQIDNTLDSSIGKTEKSMIDFLGKLKYRADQSYKRKLETEINQINKVILNLFPKGEYQERIVNSFYFKIKYGPEFIDKIYHTMDILNWDHQLILMGSV